MIFEMRILEKFFDRSKRKVKEKAWRNDKILFFTWREKKKKSTGISKLITLIKLN
mgnify:CR=1 FL=1